MLPQKLPKIQVLIRRNSITAGKMLLTGIRHNITSICNIVCNCEEVYHCFVYLLYVYTRPSVTTQHRVNQMRSKRHYC